jgi:regulator of protease activity HflC (stomatin/prohibitin superfamily)
VIGKLELDKTFEERNIINAQVVAAIDEAALNWGVRYCAMKSRTSPHPKKFCWPCSRKSRPSVKSAR